MKMSCMIDSVKSGRRGTSFAEDVSGEQLRIYLYSAILRTHSGLKLSRG